MMINRTTIYMSLMLTILLPKSSYATPISPFNPQYMNIFYRMWSEGPVLRKAANGLPRLTMRGLHDAIMKRPYLPADRQAETAILRSFSRSGLYPSPDHALKATCRGDICETLFVELKRPRRTGASQNGNNPLGKASIAASKACGRNYRSSMVGGDRTGQAQGGMAFFCIADNKTEV